MLAVEESGASTAQGCPVATPCVLISSWSDGLFIVAGNAIQHELAGRPVRNLTGDEDGRALAIVDGHVLCLRTAAGEWSEILASDSELSCCVPVGGAIYAGTDDARLLRIGTGGLQQFLRGFDEAPGRDTWYAGTAIVDGKTVGPPLGVRSIATTCDGAALLANVHVGGILRSVDAGRTWQPTIDIESDVHQVCAHPFRPELAAAACAKGLCISRDAGASWTIECEGLHATHCAAVAFGKNDVYVSASEDPFSPRGAVYRRSIDGSDSLRPLRGGMPEWTDGRVDTGCIAARDATIALVDGSGCLYVSTDDGATWSALAGRFPNPSALCLVPS